MSLKITSTTKAQVTILSLVLSLLARFTPVTAVAISSFVITGFFTAALGVSVLNVNNAIAHQQKMAITTVLFNPRTKNLEVTHRFDLHDAEHAVKEIFDGGADIMNSEKTQSDFAQYVVNRFAIYDMNKTQLPLSFVGTELEGKHFWVYQETPAPANLAGLYIQHNALRDIWYKQTNTINVEGMGDIQTLTFTDSTEILSVEFTHH
jgi:hypothetical protein